MATLLTWDDGTLPDLDGPGVTYDDQDGYPDPGCLSLAQQAGEHCAAQWTFTPTPTAALRFYLRTPATWPSSAPGIAMLVGLDSLLQVTLGGSGQPGQLRLSRGTGATVVQSSSGTFATSTWYRIEAQLDVTNSRGRVAGFLPDATTALWDSGWQTHADFAASDVQKILVGRPSSSPTLAQVYADTILATDDVSAWIGPASTPDPGGATFHVLDAGVLVPAHIAGVIADGQLVPAHAT